MSAFFSDLPIYQVYPQLSQAITNQQDILLVAQPGAGKTSCVPLWVWQSLVERGEPDKKVILLEPRRLATRGAALRLAQALGEPVGQTVGYRMRLDTKVSQNTRIEVMTLGVFLNLLQEDPSLEDVAAVVFDEFHERSLDNDLAFSLLLQARELFRDDAPLPILVMSATLDTREVLPLIPDAVQIESEGKSYPVEVSYHSVGLDTRGGQPLHKGAQRQAKLQACAKVILQALNDLARDTQNQAKSVLAFLPGQWEIAQCQDALLELGLPNQVQVHSLYGQMPFDAQTQALSPAPDGQAKVVLATAIAESSLTIEGIGAVVDLGLSREARFDANTGLSQLVTVDASKAQAKQRAGRAGRLGPGRCYRLWSQDQHSMRVGFPQPEILTADMSSLLLQLYRWGVTDTQELEWVTPPTQGRVAAAHTLLKDLGAIDETAGIQLTELGEQMSQLGTHPRLAAMIAGALSPNDQVLKLLALDEPQKSNWLATMACYVAAYVSEIEAQQADLTQFLSRIERLPKAQKQRVSQQVSQWLKRCEGLAPNKGQGSKATQSPWQEVNNGWNALSEAQQQSVLAWLLALAFPERIALYKGQKALARPTDKAQTQASYQLANGKQVVLAAPSPLSRYTALVVAQLHQPQGQSLARVSLAVGFDQALLTQFWPERIVTQPVAYWDEGAKRLRCEEQTRLGLLCLAAKPSQKVSETERIQAWRDYLTKRGLTVLNWTNKAQALRARLGFLKHCASQDPESEVYRQYKRAAAADVDLQWPDVSDDALLANLDQWLAPHLANCQTLDALKKVDLLAALKSLVDWTLLQPLERLAPEQLTVPSGRQVTVDYSDFPPSLSLKLQDMFGCEQTPSVAGQAIKLTLLSPAMRPIQVTQDLGGFWQSSYAQVQKDMKSQYPKHYWPDNPAEVVATKTSLKKHR
ncbi:MAG: ATP-dependent helicase HrpB [Pontibacterium sp.]